MKNQIKSFVRPALKLFRKLRDKKILKEQVRNADVVRLIIGASYTRQPGWISTQVSELNLLNLNDWTDALNGKKVASILAEHVWEHLSLPDGLQAAKNCYQYMQDQAYLRIAVPDGNFPDPEYIDRVKVNGSAPGSDDHKVLYTISTLKNLFETAGFTVEPLEYYDDQGVFHQKNWSPEQGMIMRSLKFDERNRDGKANYTSIIIDAFKKS